MTMAARKSLGALLNSSHPDAFLKRAQHVLIMTTTTLHLGRAHTIYNVIVQMSKRGASPAPLLPETDDTRHTQKRVKRNADDIFANDHVRYTVDIWQHMAHINALSLRDWINLSHTNLAFYTLIRHKLPWKSLLRENTYFARLRTHGSVNTEHDGIECPATRMCTCLLHQADSKQQWKTLVKAVQSHICGQCHHICNYDAYPASLKRVLRNAHASCLLCPRCMQHNYPDAFECVPWYNHYYRARIKEFLRIQSVNHELIVVPKFFSNINSSDYVIVKGDLRGVFKIVYDLFVGQLFITDGFKHMQPVIKRVINEDNVDEHLDPVVNHIFTYHNRRHAGEDVVTILPDANSVHTMDDLLRIVCIEMWNRFFIGGGGYHTYLYF